MVKPSGTAALAVSDQAIAVGQRSFLHKREERIGDVSAVNEQNGIAITFGFVFQTNTVRYFQNLHFFNLLFNLSKTRPACDPGQASWQPRAV
jgi:hypothetical protein